MEANISLLGYDTETTSNKPQTTGVVQLGAVLRNEAGESSALFNQLCDPGMPISAEAESVHGISSEMVQGAESDTAAMKKLYRFVDENQNRIIIVGHNICGFDLPILWRIGGEGRRLPILWIDTLVAAVRVFPDAESHKLSDLTEWLQLGSVENAHDAMADIEMVFALADYIRRGLMKSWEEMANWCMTPRVLTRAHFGKHKGKLWGRPERGDNRAYVPRPYVKFICDKFEDPIPDLIETVKAKYGLRFKNVRTA